MGKIIFLPQAVVTKTAAGEVIENPASVVKELVENSLDAGATSIKIALSEGGKKKIVVADNGCGMCKEDLLICHKEHTSGKISTEEDLGRISSLGFRGEALNSISCVSDFSIKSFSSQEDDSQGGDSQSGWKIPVLYGKAGEIEPIGMPQGTVVEVQNLFANFPARLEFLKTSQYEFQKIYYLVLLFVLANPNVSFVILHNEKPVLEAPVHYNLEKRLELAFGHSDFFLPLEFTAGHISVGGYLSMPQKSSNSFADLYFYINNRPVKWLKGLQQIKKAYGTLLEKHQFPKGALFLKVPFEMVDVNVHPRKEEVRFKNEALVLEILEKAVLDLLA